MGLILKIKKNLSTIHIEIWRAVPELLTSVMGLLNDELTTEDSMIRILATDTVGAILGISPSRVDFVSQHHDTWNNWMNRISDKSPLVREIWTMKSYTVLANRVNVIKEVSNGLTKCLIDTDRKVRLAACKTVSLLLSEHLLLTKIRNKTLLETLGSLTRERDPTIRNTVIDTIV